METFLNISTARTYRVFSLISHHHKCVFVHIPKCGGQSIETAFLHDIGLDWKRRAPLLLRFNDNPRLGPPRLAHLRARDYVALGYLPQEMFEHYFKFAVVRNPYRRIVSAYQYLDTKTSFHEFLTKYLTDDPKNDLHYFLRPQMDYLSDDAGNLLVDEVYELENIANGFAKIQERSGLKCDLPHVNSSSTRLKTQDSKRRRKRAKRALFALDLATAKREYFGLTEMHKDWTEYFQDERCRLKVAEYYDADFKALGYATEL